MQRHLYILNINRYPTKPLSILNINNSKFLKYHVRFKSSLHPQHHLLNTTHTTNTPQSADAGAARGGTAAARTGRGRVASWRDGDHHRGRRRRSHTGQEKKDATRLGNRRNAARWVRWLCEQVDPVVSAWFLSEYQSRQTEDAKKKYVLNYCVDMIAK